MENLLLALKRPFTDIKKLVIGYILFIIPIVNLLVNGYFLRCALSAMKNDYNLPEWNDWKGLFIDGVLSLGITIIYFSPLIFLVGIFNLYGFTSLVWLYVFFFLALVCSYFMPSALMNYIKTSSFNQGFVLDVFKRTFSKEYFVTWVVALFYSAIIYVFITFVLALIPYEPVHNYLSLLFMFIVQITVFTLFGDVYKKL